MFRGFDRVHADRGEDPFGNVMADHRRARRIMGNSAVEDCSVQTGTRDRDRIHEIKFLSGSQLVQRVPGLTHRARTALFAAVCVSALLTAAGCAGYYPAVVDEKSAKPPAGSAASRTFISEIGVSKMVVRIGDSVRLLLRDGSKWEGIVTGVSDAGLSLSNCAGHNALQRSIQSTEIMSLEIKTSRRTVEGILVVGVLAATLMVWAVVSVPMGLK